MSSTLDSQLLLQLLAQLKVLRQHANQARLLLHVQVQLGLQPFLLLLCLL